jgi:hypothetical protein
MAVLAVSSKNEVQRKDKLFPNTANRMDAKTFGESQKMLSSVRLVVIIYFIKML